MRSAIDTADYRPNTARRFGAAAHYHVVRVYDHGQVHTAMLTHDALWDGVRRAQDNPEDVPPLSLRERLRFVAWRVRDSLRGYLRGVRQ